MSENDNNPDIPRSKQFLRSRDDRVISGVCGGLAAYLGVPALPVRVFFAILMLLGGGIGGTLYLLLWLTVQPEPATIPGRLRDNIRQAGDEVLRKSWEMQEEAWQSLTNPTAQTILALGQAMMIAGGIALLIVIFPSFFGNLDLLWIEGGLLLFGGAVIVWRILNNRNA